MPPSKRRASPGASSADAAWPRAAPACCAALIGASGLLGWWLGVPSLQSVLPSLPAMRPNVALGLMAAGSGLLLIPGGGRGWRPGLASAAGALACLLGLLTLAEHMVLVPRGLDQRLAAGSSTPLAIDPGRMSPAAAVALGCAGAAVVLLAWAARAPHSAGSRRAAGLAHLLAAVPAAVSYLSLASHAYAVAGLDGFGPFAAAALNTAVALGLLAAAILRSLPELGWGRAFADRPVARGVLARLVPLSLLLPFLAGAWVVAGARAGYYDPWFSPALLALATAAAAIGLAWIAVAAVRQAEGRLRASEAEARQAAALLEAIGASSPDLIYAKDTTGRVLYANPATLAAIGKPASSVLGRTAVEHADDPAEGAALLANDLRVVETAAAEVVNETYTSPDGTRRIWQSTKAPLRDTAGAVIGLVGVGTDVTAQREAERRQAFLLALADRLHAAPREAMDAAADLLGTHLGVSRAGYGEADELGETLTIHHEHRDDTVPSAVGTHVLAEFGAAIVTELRAGRTLVVADVVSDPRTRGASAAYLARGTRSTVTVPLVRDGALRATLYVNHRDPRAWTEAEVRLVEEVAARTWAVVEQARAEAALERAAEEFRTLAEGIPTLCWMAEPDGHIYWYNRRWYDYTGATPEQMEGSGWQSVHDPDVLPLVLERWRASLATGTPFEMTFPLRGADGQFRPFLTRIAPVRGADGQVRRWFGVNTDVSEALARETALRRSEAQFRATADALPGLLFVATPLGQNTYVNDGFCTYTGRARQDLLGDRWTEVLHPDDSERGWAIWQEAVQTGAPYLAEYRFRRHDGAWRWHMVRALPSREADGTIHRWVGTCTDIHDRRVLEEELRGLTQSLEARVQEEVAAREAAQRRAAHAERMQALGQLAGGIAHDLNNVLQAVQGGTMLIEKRARDPEDTRRLAKMVLEAVARGASITRRLLSFARRGDLRAESVDAAALLDGLRDILGHALGAGIAVRVEVEAGLPALLADKGQLETALVNLATNARDAMPEGGTLTLAADRAVVADGTPHPAGLAPGVYVRLRVIDTGTGMDQATLARVMEPFFTTKPRGKGTGLGLSMAQGFAEQSGGALRVESAPGQGTMVFIWLPQADAVPPPAASPRVSLAAAPGAGTAGRVLLVDDEAMVRETLALELEEAGYAVLPAADAGAALAALEAGETVDILVTDLTMPGGMDGLGLIREVRARRPGLPAVLLTGYAGDGTGAALAVSGIVNGTFSLLRKPISGTQLADRVAALLAARAGEGEAAATPPPSPRAGGPTGWSPRTLAPGD